jgi:hypothetical protein
MVAMLMPAIAPTPVPASALAGRGGLVQFTVDDVLLMLRAGRLAEDASTELLEGYIVRADRSQFGGDPTTHSPGHRYTVRRLTGLAATIDSPQRCVQIQSPIVCGPRQMPQPDFAVIRGSDADYADRLPAAADVLCVIEVADSSLERDRFEKLPIYARSGVPQYVILNLRNRTAETYADADPSEGRYRSSETVSFGGAFDLLLGDQPLSLPLSDVLTGDGL